MLSLRLNLADLGAEPRSVGGELFLGESHVSPFSSAPIQMSLMSDPDEVRIWIGERDDPYSGLNDANAMLSRYADFDIFEGAKIQIRRGRLRPQVIMYRTRSGSSPLYIAENSGNLIASWRFEEVATRLREIKPNIQACRMFIEHGTCRVRQQILDGMYMLWPGETASFTESGLTFSEATVPAEVQPSTLTDAALVTDEFLRLIRDAVGDLKRCTSMIELSGGLDSSCVALAIRGSGSHIRSYGLLHDGPGGRQHPIAGVL